MTGLGDGPQGVPAERPTAAALTLWGTYALAFSLATLAVRTVIASHRPHAQRGPLRCTGATPV